MPFTINDVDKHNKGLSPKAKETWVEVANNVLKTCTDDDCDASAIKQANAVVAKEFAEDKTIEIKGIEIFKTGVWHKDEYTVKDIDDMVSSFSLKGFEAPVKIGHNKEQEKDGQPSFGWINHIYREGEKLLADFTDVPRKLGEAIKRKQFRQVSSEIYWNLTKDMPRVLRAVAILGADIPEVKGLAPLDQAQILLSENTNIKYYDEETIKQEEKQMSVELEKKIVELETQLKTKDEDKDKETKELSEQLDAVKVELSKEKATAKTNDIGAYTEGLKKDGKLLPAHEGLLKDILLSANDEKTHTYSDEGKDVDLNQTESIKKLFSEMGKAVDFDEKGKDGKGTKEVNHDAEAGKEVDRIAREFMEEDENLDYSKALKKVAKDKPELYKEYMDI